MGRLLQSASALLGFASLFSVPAFGGDERSGAAIVIDERTVPIRIEECERNYRMTDAVFGFGGVCRIPFLGDDESLSATETVASASARRVTASLVTEGKGISITFELAPRSIRDEQSFLPFDQVRRALAKLIRENPDVTLVVQTIEKD